jgi:general L-amino acid transport system substrate-binding protein
MLEEGGNCYRIKSNPIFIIKKRLFVRQVTQKTQVCEAVHVHKWLPAMLSRYIERNMNLLSGRRLLSCAVFLAVGLLAAATSHGGETLRGVKARDVVRCGVSEGITGFSARDSTGRWSGMDADFCRAVAAAVLGDANKVKFIPLRASERFPALQADMIDLLARNTTCTLEREAVLKAMFPGIICFDGQAFMVPASSGIRKIKQLNGKTICIEKGTTHQQFLPDYFAAHNMSFRPLVIDSAKGVADAFFAKRCAAYTSDASQLAAVRLRAPGGPEKFVILPERITKEPIGPVVTRNDYDWYTLVRWVLFALIAAEENGITRENVLKMRDAAANPAIRRALGAGGGFGKALGVDDGWALRAIRAVGNYGQIFERNLGRGSPLGLDRGLNRLWTRGGLIYAPPVR